MTQQKIYIVSNDDINLISIIINTLKAYNLYDINLIIQNEKMVIH